VLVACGARPFPEGRALCKKQRALSNNKKEQITKFVILLALQQK
jgi:hypothetical protein